MARQARSADRLVGKGRGGAKDWIAVRLNSFALLALYAWLLAALVLLPDLSYDTVRDWLRRPLNSVMMILLIIVSFWHTKYGLKELIDDYVLQPFPQAVCIAAMYAFTIFGAAFGVWSVARIALVP
ncbi:succinate dehydrogenase, hydrophobic membrane anchor protein [Erythrobacter sp. NFXS35]|uniref:succinate dehydrogenase, hydrophobic membrane anchor protein n=1 Tax=Erythrobacter sp. NFXS35 TaxID=2818436 RepID=UPI0032DE8A83